MFQLSVAPERAPDKPAYLEVGFDQGEPVSINGRLMAPVTLLDTLNKLGGKHGIGRVDLVENRFVGMKSRGVYETPGGTILYAAHRAVESLTLDREVMLQRDQLMPKFAQLVYNGFWFSPEMDALKAFITEAQKNVTGVARLKLYKGSCTVVGRRSSYSLYDPTIATFEEDSVYNQADATGFIKLNALRLRIGARIRHKHR
jgi:argininosuccinate synthase